MIHVRGVSLHPDGAATIEWVNPETDLKSNGLLINHVAHCPAEEYEDEIDEVVTALRRLVESLQADQLRLGPPEGPPVPDPDDDDE